MDGDAGRLGWRRDEARGERPKNTGAGLHTPGRSSSLCIFPPPNVSCTCCIFESFEIDASSLMVIS